MSKHKVVYTVRFVAEVDDTDYGNVEDAACDIDIPENASSKYVTDSFEVISIEPVKEVRA